MNTSTRSIAVTGSLKALAFLFSGGHAISVRRKVDRAKRRKQLAQTWSRAAMGNLPHPLSIARSEFAARFPGTPNRISLKAIRKRMAVRP